jgi:hypothetical protein
VSDIVCPKHEFDPEELRELSVAFENCCAALPQTASPEFREKLAHTLLGWAKLQKADSVHLYVRALDRYRSQML